MAVVGGGDVALEDALFLSRICEKVYLIHRRDEFRGAKILRDQVTKNDKIQVIWNTVVTKIDGNERVESISIKDVHNDVDKSLKVDGIFIAVGTAPQSTLLKDELEMDERGYIAAGEDGVTNISRKFFVGWGNQRTKKSAPSGDCCRR